MTDDWRQYVTKHTHAVARDALNLYGEYARVCVSPPLDFCHKEFITDGKCAKFYQVFARDVLSCPAAERA